jgi:membrane-associated phospholipid phosphatase
MFWQKVLSLDEKITQVFRIDDHPKWLRKLGTFFAHSGDSWFILLLLILTWYFTKGVWHRISALMAGAVFILAILVLTIKFLIRRKRPEGTWGAIYRNSDPHSFPSGHAARTMMLANLMLILGPTWLGIVLVVWAIIVSLARVGMGVHYLSDIAAGIVLGILFALGFSQLIPWFISTLPYFF